ncbi:hypothetical protein MJT46_003519 [Ovis ammon polii x Ovis aries]|nr:hypothetical protein MJT46_003519 [Ovis ammon polii x Ovis aries]
MCKALDPVSMGQFWIQKTPRPAGSWEPKAPEMKALLLPIALSLLAALRAQDPPSCPLEPQKIAGTWYVKAIVTDGDLPKETRSRKVSPVTVTALGSGDLELRFTFRGFILTADTRWDKCVHSRMKGPLTFLWVVLAVHSTGKQDGGKKHMYILELPVEGHCVLYCEGQRQGKSVRVGKLIGRNPDVNPEALEAFKKFAQRKGLSLEDIFTPEQTGCSPEESPEALRTFEEFVERKGLNKTEMVSPSHVVQEPDPGSVSDAGSQPGPKAQTLPD